MQIIYSIGKPGHLDFYTTDKREDVPPDATVLAICTGARTLENTDEDLFDAISDQEYFTVQRMIYEAARREAISYQSARPTAPLTLEISVRRFFNWLTSTTSPAEITTLQKNPSNC